MPYSNFDESVQFGLRSTSDIDEKRIHVDVSEEIAELQTDKAPLTKLTRQIGSEPTTKPEYLHYEGDLAALTVESAGGETSASATTVQLDSGDAAGIHKDAVIHVVETGEVMLVTEVDRNNDTIDVQRGMGDSTAVPIPDEATLCIIGNAHKEGSGAPEEIVAGLVRINNYTQIFRHSWSVTGTLASTIMDAGNPEWDRLSRQKSLEHVRAIEMAYFLGVKNEDLAGSEPRRMTGGLDEHIKSNRFNVGSAAIDADLFDEYAKNIFDYGSGRKFMFTGANAIQCINSFARDQLRLEQGEDTYGLRVQRLETGFGTLDIVYHKLLSRHGFADTAYIIDPENLQERQLSNNNQQRYNVLRMNIQKPDEDKLKSEYLTESGFEVFQEMTHAKLYNIGTPGSST